MKSWEDRISRLDAPAVPILVRRMHRIFWVPPRYRSVAAVALDGRRFTVRGMAERTGYSTGGVHAALRAMARLGMGVLRSVRGHYGGSRFTLADDVTVSKSNVHTAERSFFEERGTVVRTLDPEWTVGELMEAWGK